MRMSWRLGREVSSSLSWRVAAPTVVLHAVEDAFDHVPPLVRHAPLKRPCSRPGSYQRSSGVPIPGDNTPRIIDDRTRESYRNRRPGLDHRDLPNTVMGMNLV